MSHLCRTLVVAPCLLALACFQDPPRPNDTAGTDDTGDTTGDGDGDGDPGDGDGDGDPGDGDGDNDVAPTIDSFTINGSTPPPRPSKTPAPSTSTPSPPTPTATSRTVLCRPRGRDLEVLAKMIEAGTLRTVLDSVYPLAEVREALARSRSQRARGKIILRVRQP